MKYYLLYLFITITLSAEAQSHLIKQQDNGIYLSDSDFLTHRLSDAFENAKGSKLNNNRRDYLIIQKENCCDTFYFDSIWGYRKNGEDWRVYRHEYYKIIYTDKKICLFDLPGSGQGEGVHTRHYFSSSPSAPVCHLSKHNLLITFRDKPAFVQKIKDMPLTESVFKWNRKTHLYRFMEWL
jgi:hypothetical protein